jgi:hypothetical protein
VDGVDRAPVELGRAGRARGRDPAEHLRRRLRRPVLAARVDALRRHGEEEAVACLQPAALEDRLQDLAGRAGPRRRLEHDELTLAQHLGDAARRALHDREVGLALAGERRRERDQHGVRVAQLLVARRRVDVAAGDQRCEPLVRDVRDVRLAPVERRDDVVEHVDEQHAAAGLRERGRERHADVTGADDRDVVVGALSHGRAQG